MKNDFHRILEDTPIIAAIKDFDGLEKCFSCESRIIFILFGDICNIADIVAQVKAHDKIAMVHIDLITGLSSREIAVDFIKKNTKADGIITTKPSLAKYAASLSLYTVLRFFFIDSMAFHNIEKQLQNVTPDVIEILPALMPRIITRICNMVSFPVIAGGLISDKEDVMTVLSSGAASISSTNENVWFL